jgi:hypothetical protein
MVVLINVEIGNCLDDTTRNKVLVCDGTDANALNNLGAMADMHVELMESESILRIRIIRPINISTDKSLYDIVKSNVHIF